MNIIDTFHLFFLFYPICLFILPSYLLYGYKYMFLLHILTPLHWIFLEDRCILTKVSNTEKLENNKKTNSYFSEEYLWWMYDPACYLLNYEKTSNSYAKVVNIHLGINFILFWYYTFYIHE